MTSSSAGSGSRRDEARRRRDAHDRGARAATRGAHGPAQRDDHGAEVDEGVEVRASITSTSTRQWRHCGHEAADEEGDSYDTEEDEYVEERDGG